MDERLQFILDAQSDRFTMTELCARYGVSRRIGYKWLLHFAEEGKRGLADRSRAPHTCPHKIRPVLAELLCEFRRSHPDYRILVRPQTLRRALAHDGDGRCVLAIGVREAAAAQEGELAPEPSREASWVGIAGAGSGGAAIGNTAIQCTMPNWARRPWQHCP
jgi:DNA-binding transcriptional LysR family regulator